MDITKLHKKCQVFSKEIQKQILKTLVLGEILLKKIKERK